MSFNNTVLLKTLTFQHLMPIDQKGAVGYRQRIKDLHWAPLYHSAWSLSKRLLIWELFLLAFFPGTLTWNPYSLTFLMVGITRTHWTLQHWTVQRSNTGSQKFRLGRSHQWSHVLSSLKKKCPRSHNFIKHLMTCLHDILKGCTVWGENVAYSCEPLQDIRIFPCDFIVYYSSNFSQRKTRTSLSYNFDHFFSF